MRTLIFAKIQDVHVYFLVLCSIYSMHIPAYLILLHFALLRFADIVFFYKLKAYGNPELSDDDLHLIA